MSFDESELEVLDHISAALQTITKEWDLHQGSNLAYELCLHVHGIQSFVIQHMLQREAPGVGGHWYGQEE